MERRKGPSFLLQIGFLGVRSFSLRRVQVPLRLSALCAFAFYMLFDMIATAMRGFSATLTGVPPDDYAATAGDCNANWHDILHLSNERVRIFLLQQPVPVRDHKSLQKLLESSEPCCYFACALMGSRFIHLECHGSSTHVPATTNVGVYQSRKCRIMEIS